MVIMSMVLRFLFSKKCCKMSITKKDTARECLAVSIYFLNAFS